MIVPRERLLFWVGALAPLSAAGALLPALAPAAVGAAAGLALVAAVDAWRAERAVRRVRVTVPDVVRMTVERPAAVPVTLARDDGEERELAVALGLPAAFRTETDEVSVRLPAGMGAGLVSVACTPGERGRFRLASGLVEAESPLGLWGARRRTDCRAELRVYPSLAGERRRLAALFLRRGAFGVHAQRTVGHGREFEKLREYMPGDSYEDIHWKATARRSRPVTKLFQVERTREVYAAIDTSRLSARAAGAEPALDRFLTAALVLGVAAEQQGDLIGLATFSDRVRRFLRAGRGRAHYNVCRDALYTLTPEPVSPDFDELAAFMRLRVRKRSLFVVLTDLSDPVVAEGFLRAVELVCRQHLVLVFMVQPPGIGPLFEGAEAGSVDEVYRRLGGHVLWHELRETGRALHRKGVQFVMAEREALSAEVVSRYTAVKARQML